MRLLLTSGGVTNASIRGALAGLLGKPIAGCSALCIPTAEWGHPLCTPASAWRFIAGRSPSPMCDLGWKSVGVLELTALPTAGGDRTLGVVGFSIFPHLGDMPGNTMAAAERDGRPRSRARRTQSMTRRPSR